ncbi:MAG: hypothetical protein PVG49_15950 [Desulfobacteraceae bacterium]|jgi:hypothetical protein
MLSVLKKWLIWAALGALLYGALSYHIVIVGKSPHLLKKEKLTLEYTFFSTHSKRLKTIMQIDALRRAGIGELLVEEGEMSEKEYERYLQEYGYDDEY